MISNEFKEKMRREMVVHDVPLTLEEQEFIEFLICLYSATETLKPFQENLLHRLGTYRTQAQEYVYKVTNSEG